MITNIMGVHKKNPIDFVIVLQLLYNLVSKCYQQEKETEY